jgi:glucose-6-phosphate 1-epimerase
MDLVTTINTLYQQYGQLSGITIECQNELVAIGIKNKVAVAEVFLQGAQLTRYQRIGESPVLFLSDECSYRSGEALRGGIPICWPWFGDLQKNPEAVQQHVPADVAAHAPAHGFVRHRQWQVHSITTPSDELTVVELGITTNSDEAYWPYATSLVYRIEIGVNINVSLLISNHDEKPLTFSNALHSYFSVNNIDNVSIQGFNQEEYIDALDDWAIKQQEGDVTFTQEVDRIYTCGCTPAVITTDDRAIQVSSQGSHSSVIWNPWVKKSQSLSQYKEDDYKQMVCIETANVMDDCITLAPEKSHTLQLTIV